MVFHGKDSSGTFNIQVRACLGLERASGAFRRWMFGNSPRFVHGEPLELPKVLDFEKTAFIH